MEKMTIHEVADLRRPLEPGQVLDTEHAEMRLAAVRRWLAGRGVRPCGSWRNPDTKRLMNLWPAERVRREVDRVVPSGMAALSPSRRREIASKGHETRRRGSVAKPVTASEKISTGDA